MNRQRPHLKPSRASSRSTTLLAFVLLHGAGCATRGEDPEAGGKARAGSTARAGGAAIAGGTAGTGGKTAASGGHAPGAGGGDAGNAGAKSPIAGQGALPGKHEDAGGELHAFPGAEGFGRDAKGGRGGTVCHVTTLDDSGAGSLRDCLSASDRTIVFDTSGWITLRSNLAIGNDRITIAGQTAPGAGIGIRGRKVSVAGDDLVLRHLRVRRGIKVTEDRDDAMTVSSASDNVILDHCSVSFGTDETLSMPGDEGIGPHNLTVQWTIIAWGLQRNNHSAGALFTSNKTTIHHSIWAFNKTRNPRARSEVSETRGLGGHLDWVNNVIYGWNAPDPVGMTMGWSLSYDPFILAGTSNGQHSANAVGNYFISTRSAEVAFTKGTSNFQLFFQDNRLDGNANGKLDVSKRDVDMISGAPTMLSQRLAGPSVTTQSPEDAYASVLESAGAIAPMRDQVDSALITHIQAQDGILIQSERDLMSEGVGDEGYGTLPEIARPAGFDSDGDGMADEWERSRGLDPSNAEDRNADADSDGYTNLEEYLHWLL